MDSGNTERNKQVGAMSVSIMKINHLYLGDCVNIMRNKLKANSFELIFADPPYNISRKKLTLIGNKTGGNFYKINEKWDQMTEAEYRSFTNEWINCCYSLLKHSGSIYVCCTMHNIEQIIYSLKNSKMNIKNIITWHKTNAMPNITRRMFTHSTEFIVYATKNSNWIFNHDKLKEINPEKQKNGNSKQMRDVWSIPITQGKERLKADNGRAFHPAQKPEEIVKRAIIASSNKGNLVLDPFIGTGTTAVVAEKLNRNWIGIEKDARYKKQAMIRIRAGRK